VGGETVKKDADESGMPIRRHKPPAITEKVWLAQVRGLARALGWRVYHAWLSIHSEPGFPDLTLIKPPRLIFAELKTEGGKVSDKQQEWIDLLESIGGTVEVFVWRPSQFEAVAAILRDKEVLARPTDGERR
jgi:hypothetical protein